MPEESKSVDETCISAVLSNTYVVWLKKLYKRYGHFFQIENAQIFTFHLMKEIYLPLSAFVIVRVYFICVLSSLEIILLI